MALWLELYKCTTYHDLVTLFYRGAGRSARLLRAMRQLAVIMPGWKGVAQRHLQGYREFVMHWLTDALTSQDWARATRWARRKGENPVRWLLTGAVESRFSFEAWLIHELKKNPHQPFEEGYRQVLELIMAERAGRLALRPKFCTDCGTLYVPNRDTQRWCSARCRNRVLQRRFRAAGTEGRREGKGRPAMPGRKAGEEA